MAARGIVTSLAPNENNDQALLTNSNQRLFPVGSLTFGVLDTSFVSIQL